MYRIGQEEIDAVAEVIRGGQPFRYMKGSQCGRFEERYSEYLGIEHVVMTASGTNALVAALAGLEIGPGDEVIVPCHTYMATAVAVLAVGAIPVIIDIDDSLMLDPEDLEASIGPRTKAVIPVHMWGLVCDMDRIMEIARKHDLRVVEDSCQAVGGAYKGRRTGAIGDVGAFSFNYYKNMTAGEGGAVVSNHDDVIKRAQCAIDCCGYYWKGSDDSPQHFVANGARSNEISGAILNVQLDRIDDIITTMRSHKQRILRETADTGLQPIRHHSLEHECGAHVMYTLPSEELADQFSKQIGCGIAGRTGRHVYTVWHPILDHKGGHHPAMNPFNFEENQECRMDYSPDMCAKSLDILNRTVMIANHPDNSDDKVSQRIEEIRAAADQLLATP